VTETNVQQLLTESFGVMALELPAAWIRFCASLQGRIVELAVDDERFTVHFAVGTAVVHGLSDSADAHTRTTRRTILDVLDARLSLRDAVMGDLLQVVAPLQMMDQLHTGILAYVHGAVRCPSFPSLLTRFRALSGVE
jgi:hypothetical protein